MGSGNVIHDTLIPVTFAKTWRQASSPPKITPHPAPPTLLARLSTLGPSDLLPRLLSFQSCLTGTPLLEMTSPTPHYSQSQGRLDFKETRSVVTQVAASSITKSTVRSPSSYRSTSFLFRYNTRASLNSAAPSNPTPMFTSALFNTNPFPFSSTALVAAILNANPTPNHMDQDLHDDSDSDSDNEDFKIVVPKIKFVSLEIIIEEGIQMQSRHFSALRAKIDALSSLRGFMDNHHCTPHRLCYTATLHSGTLPDQLP